MWSIERQPCPKLHPNQPGQQMEGGGGLKDEEVCSDLLRPSPGVLCPALGSSAQERQEPPGVSPDEVCKGDHRTGAPVQKRHTEKVGNHQSREEKAPGRP